MQAARTTVLERRNVALSAQCRCWEIREADDRGQFWSATCPELLSSFATRSTAAGDVDMARAESNSDGTRGTANARASMNTAAKVPAASTTLVTPSHGLKRSQRRLMR